MIVILVQLSLLK